MNKKIVVSLLAALILASFQLGEAQQSKKVPRIGVLRAGSPPDPLVEAFRQGLRELGYTEGKNIAIEERWAEGKPARLPKLAAELVTLKVDVIVTSTTPAIQAAKQATTVIPIIFGTAADPVGTGLVTSLARPGGNITGLSNVAPDLDARRLELVKETLPKVTRLAFIWDPSNLGMTLRFKEIQTAARELGITLQFLEVRNAKDLESALEATSAERISALWVSAPIVNSYRRQIADFADKKRLPLIYDTREHVSEVGGLMSYGPDFLDLHRRAATYVDKILKGAKPADLPVQQPMKFEFVINLKAAKQIGVTIPPNVLARADKVIK